MDSYSTALTHLQTHWPQLHIRPSSVTTYDGSIFALVRTEQGQHQLAVIAPSEGEGRGLTGFEGSPVSFGERVLYLGSSTAHNAAWLRQRLDWLHPTPLGLRTSVGLGDRLGLATPGHLRAVREVGSTLAPIPAQQSIREMARTGRSPQQVMDDAMWGVFAEGWHEGFGADADHLKTIDDIDRCLAAGYTFYTFDPGQFVDDDSLTLTPTDLQMRLDALPWDVLEDSTTDLFTRYLERPWVCENHTILFDKQILAQAAVKYGQAVAHVVTLYRHLAQAGAGKAWEVEVSVDETAFPTTYAEHVYLAIELTRLDVHWVSLAPRFPGRFEKGVDYLGDVQEFENAIAVHAAIARTFGPYKISLHSGSDKFSIYEAAARQTAGCVHLKTAGTSYLEALRTVAELDGDLMRDIYAFARERYPEDRVSYHVSADLDRAPAVASLSLETLPTLLDQFDAREILHVTFGSVLTAQKPDGHLLFYDALMCLLLTHEEAYASHVQRHFLRHLLPFVHS